MSTLRTVRALPHRSGSTDEELLLPLPGDSLVPAATDIVDRAVTLDAPVAEVWPWIAQLGKGRAGWYFPRSVERFLPRVGLRRIDPTLQQPSVGDEHADWGPGDPILRVHSVDPPHSVVYLSLRDKRNGERWPADNRQDRPEVLALSWALVLRTEGERTRLHLRLRMKLRPTRLPYGALGGLFDWLTVALLFRGLRERVRR